MNSNLQKLMIWGGILVLLVLLFNVVNNPAQTRRGSEISYSEFLNHVESGAISEATRPTL